jgi:uncharacterized protein YqeY
MGLEEKLRADQTAAMKARETRRLSCIRMLRSRIQEAAVAARAKRGKDATLDDDEAMAVVAAYAKQRRDSIDAFAAAGRDQMAEDERAELEIISEYLPAQMGDDELRTIVTESVAASGATSAKDMGAVMKLVMPRVKGQADGKRVNQFVREALN